MPAIAELLYTQHSMLSQGQLSRTVDINSPDIMCGNVRKGASQGYASLLVHREEDTSEAVLPCLQPLAPFCLHCNCLLCHTIYTQYVDCVAMQMVGLKRFHQYNTVSF